MLTVSVVILLLLKAYVLAIKYNLVTMLQFVQVTAYRFVICLSVLHYITLSLKSVKVHN
ncbi:hypothetical protein D3C75_1241660 [compost metagenome]